jgi:hypothetical protein
MVVSLSSFASNVVERRGFEDIGMARALLGSRSGSAGCAASLTLPSVSTQSGLPKKDRDLEF